MSEVERIGDQLKRAYEGPAWHGESLMELLADVTPERAAAKPLRGAHSIWEIVRHIAAWESVALRRIQGEAVQLTTEEDWPKVGDTSASAWREALETLKTGHMELRKAIVKLDDARLLQKTPGKDYDDYFLLHGVVQHDLYHAGQIALLKKG